MNKVDVQTWEVEPDEYLGEDQDGHRYYRLDDSVYRTKNGFTSWLCYMKSWKAFLKAYNVALA